MSGRHKGACCGTLSVQYLVLVLDRLGGFDVTKPIKQNQKHNTSEPIDDLQYLDWSSSFGRS